jgi:hypothetical protein
MANILAAPPPKKIPKKFIKIFPEPKKFIKIFPKKNPKKSNEKKPFKHKKNIQYIKNAKS